MVFLSMKLNLKNALILCVLSTACATEEGAVADFLLIGGQVIDGSGSDPVQADLAVTGDLISFLGEAASAGMQARDTLQVQDLVVTPGFIDLHSHAETGISDPHLATAANNLTQGITTIVVGQAAVELVGVNAIPDGYCSELRAK